jgi:hypothetical protein
MTSGATSSGTPATAYGMRRPKRVRVRSEREPISSGRKSAKAPSAPIAIPIAPADEVASPRRSGAYVVRTLIPSASANVGSASAPSITAERGAGATAYPASAQRAPRAVHPPTASTKTARTIMLMNRLRFMPPLSLLTY